VKVIVQPQNGYINRIQALASSALLAREIGADFEVQWSTSSAAPAVVDELFAPEFLQRFFVAPQVWNLEHYLNLIDAGTAVTLAGLDLGEQVFMQELKQLISANPQISEIRISAGGKFALDGLTEQFADKRGEFYREELQFSSEIESRARALFDVHGPYVGVHLRYSDRSHQAPRKNSILSATLGAASRLGIQNVFLASDDLRERDYWEATLKSKGLRPWTVSYEQALPERSAVPALVDWRVLANSAGVVYFSESSFGEEAAVAAGNLSDSASLQGSHWSELTSTVAQYSHALVTYPKRHFSRPAE